LPVALTSNWNLITRPVMTLFNSVPHPDPHNPADIERTTGFGDTVLMELVSASPKLVGNWLLGLGPTFIFPTASSDYTGQGKGRWVLQPWWATSRRNGSLAAFFRTGHLLGVLEIRT
jgi:hypothetical protein